MSEIEVEIDINITRRKSIITGDSLLNSQREDTEERKNKKRKRNIKQVKMIIRGIEKEKSKRCMNLQS